MVRGHSEVRVLLSSRSLSLQLSRSKLLVHCSISSKTLRAPPRWYTLRSVCEGRGKKKKIPHYLFSFCFTHSLTPRPEEHCSSSQERKTRNGLLQRRIDLPQLSPSPRSPLRIHYSWRRRRTCEGAFIICLTSFSPTRPLQKLITTDFNIRLGVECIDELFRQATSPGPIVSSALAQ